MLSSHWPTSMVLLILGLSSAGCAIPGLKAANDQGGQSSAWNPFSKPKMGYVGSPETTEDEFPAKKLKDPNPLKLQYAEWMEETGNLPEAKKHYSEVLAARPKEVAAMLGVARIELASGNAELAEKGFRKVLGIESASAGAQSGLGQCLAAKKQWPQAVDALTVAAKSLPEDKVVHYQLAVALVHTGEIEAAQVHFQQCVKESAGHYNTALILKDEGQLAKAEAQLELALLKDPKFKDAELWLTEIRKVRTQSLQTALSGPPEILPPVKQVAYKNYGHIGTVEIQPAVYIPNENVSTKYAQAASE